MKTRTRKRGYAQLQIAPKSQKVSKRQKANVKVRAACHPKVEYDRQRKKKIKIESEGNPQGASRNRKVQVRKENTKQKGCAVPGDMLRLILSKDLLDDMLAQYQV